MMDGVFCFGCGLFGVQIGIHDNAAVAVTRTASTLQFSRTGSSYGLDKLVARELLQKACMFSTPLRDRHHSCLMV